MTAPLLIIYAGNKRGFSPKWPICLFFLVTIYEALLLAWCEMLVSRQTEKKNEISSTVLKIDERSL